MASDSFAARRLDLHQRELRPDAIDRLPAIPQHAQAARNAGRAPGLFAMTLRRQGRGGHGGPGALRDKLRPIFVCSENMDREAIAIMGLR
jgi:hypothetical protein